MYSLVLVYAEFFGSLWLTVPHGAVGMAGSVPAVRVMRSDSSGLRRYGHHSVLLKRDVILTTGGFGEEDGQHCRMTNFHVLIKHSGCWKAGCVKKENTDKRWGEFSCWCQV